ncbi:TPA: hypothetical protein ACWMH4_003633, partial [Proteus mirabilis]
LSKNVDVQGSKVCYQCVFDWFVKNIAKYKITGTTSTIHKRGQNGDIFTVYYRRVLRGLSPDTPKPLRVFF